MFRYQNTKKFFGQISDDCTDIGAEELEELGAKDVELDYRGVSFSASTSDLYKIVYCNRLFSRILAPLHRFDCHHIDNLYNNAIKMEWEKILSPDKTFAIFANVGNSKITHSKFAAQKLKDAIADYFMDLYGRRPSVDTENPDVWINLYINKNKAFVNLDLTGSAGHKRGYRQTTVEAPMRETLAAAVIRFSGWKGDTPLHDVMCGSGTLLIEALMSYCRIPARYNSDFFGFMNLPDYSEALWETVKRTADEGIRPLPPGLISGSDIDKAAIEASIDNTSLIPFGDRIELRVADFNDAGPIENSTLIFNPPYGMRLMRDEDMPAFMRSIGDFLKQQCANSTAWIYVGSTELLRVIGLRTSQRIPLENGGLDGRLIRLDMYTGTRDP